MAIIDDIAAALSIPISRDDLLAAIGILLDNPGFVGPPGEDGATGAQGVKGDKGDKGDTGAAGADGAQGPQGIQGIQGIQGVQGEPGEGGDPLDAYPVGAIYLSVVSTSPETLFGGTWSAFAPGRMLVGLNAGDASFDTVEETGGAKTVTLTAAQSGVPAHSHPLLGGSSDDTSAPFTGPDASTSTASTFGGGVGNSTPADAAQAHENMPPYIVVYMWKRTA